MIFAMDCFADQYKRGKTKNPMKAKEKKRKKKKRKRQKRQKKKRNTTDSLFV